MIDPDAPIAEVMRAMLDFAEEAGALALALRAAGLSVSHKGDDLGQALTEADLAISRMLHARFGPRLVEEETVGALGRAGAAALLTEPGWSFVGDPIDGTKPYAGGLAGWGTMIAACRDGVPEASVCLLPAWGESHAPPSAPAAPEAQAGLLLAASEGRAWWAPTRGGRRVGDLQPLAPSKGRSFHVGWLCNAAKRFTLDYERGFFPWCESGAIADTALLATGRLDATVTNHMLWDLAPALPLFRALGFDLYHWPDLAPAPRAIVEIFDADLSAHDDLWLVCRDRVQAADLAAAIVRADRR